MNLGRHRGYSVGNIYDIFVRMAVAERFRYENVIATESSISFFIVSHILAGLGGTFSSGRTRRLTTWIHRTFYDKRLGDVCCCIFGHLYSQFGSIHDNSVVGIHFYLPANGFTIQLTNF